MCVGERSAISEYQLTEGSLGFRGGETRGGATGVNDVVKKKAKTELQGQSCVTAVAVG